MSTGRDEPPARVEQTNRWDCGLAVLAMALRLESCADAMKIIGRDPAEETPLVPWPEKRIGVSGEEMCRALWTAGLRHLHGQPDENWEGHATEHWRFHYRFKTRGFVIPWLAQEITANEAIVSVPSINYPASGHWLYVWRDRILDPSPGRRYPPSTQDGPLPIVEFIIIERRARA